MPVDLVNDPLISVRNVSKVYESSGARFVALEDVSFDIMDREFTVIIGPSGCGKSTLLGIMGGLIAPTSGEVYVEGRKVEKPLPRLISVMFQNASVFPWRTVRKNVAFPLEVAGSPAAGRREVETREIKRVGLSSFEGKFPEQLSGGMVQRVALARALAQGTRIILMDEPFGALDEQTRLSLSLELTRLWQETRNTIVFVTHSLQEAAFLADQIIVISRRPGKIKRIVNVDVRRPRDLTGEDVNRTRALLWEMIAPEALSMI